MHDALVGSFPDNHCRDCGKQGCCVKYQGALVPDNNEHYFCADDYKNRVCYYSKHGYAKPYEDEPISIKIKE